MKKAPRILILTRGNVGPHMSAPGIRASAQARVLAEQIPRARVTLAGQNEDASGPREAPYRVVSWNARNVVRLVAEHDIVISSGLPPHILPFFFQKRFVADLFSQYAMEWMEVGLQHYRGFGRRAWAERTRAWLAMQLTAADFVICNNERQRDSYLGTMFSLGLVSPRVYRADPTLRRLIDAAPHGIRPEAPRWEAPRVLRGRHPGFRERDTILIWNGGIIQWYDPAVVLEALRRIGRDDIKLLFLGASYPGIGDLGKGPRFQDAKAIAAANGQLNRTVFFEEGWVSHEEAAQYVLEADIGICTYWDNLETRYAHRTRFLDLIWAERPFICTHGDILAEEVERRGWGIVVPQGDADAVARAILRLADDKAFWERCRRNLAAARAELQWEVTQRPLIAFCRGDWAPVSPKWERFPGLVQRTAAYLARREVYRWATRA